MIEIIKGPLYSINTIKYFVCNNCGCEFVADSEEYTEVLCEKTFRPVCKCPNCKMYAEHALSKQAEYFLKEHEIYILDGVSYSYDDLIDKLKKQGRVVMPGD